MDALMPRTQDAEERPNGSRLTDHHSRTYKAQIKLTKIPVVTIATITI
jgi:hypothetical protein